MLLVLTVTVIHYKDIIGLYAKELLGSENPWRVSDKTISIMGYRIPDIRSIVSPNSIKPKTLKGSTDIDKVKEMISYLKQFNYSSEQSNPLNLEQGGNCQAFTLYIQRMAEQNGILSEIVTTPNHMYNRIIVDGVKYKLDIVNNILERED